MSLRHRVFSWLALVILLVTTVKQAAAQATPDAGSNIASPLRITR